MKRVDRHREMDHMFVLMKEITVLKERFEPHDTGHIRGAVRVLEDGVHIGGYRELERWLNHTE